MKNLILAIFLTLSGITVQAGNDGSKLTTEASDIARRMANQIELNELEYIQVRNYTIEKLETVAQIKEMYSHNPHMMLAKISEVETDYSYRIMNLLNASQFQNYLALSHSFKANFDLIANISE